MKIEICNYNLINFWIPAFAGMTKMKVKALVLLSGGLDSMLAAKILMEQGIEVTGLSFKSYFFKTDRAKKVAEQLGIKLIEVDFSEEHLKMVKHPAHGYGKNINPCIDCHGLMLKKAGEIIKGGSVGAILAVVQNRAGASPAPTDDGKIRAGASPAPTDDGKIRAGASPAPTKDKYDFIATGEVLGERPMSQNKDSLKLVEKISGLRGKLLRPLSAKLLDETEAEKQGKINRNKLFNICGRSRQKQLALIKKYKIKEYASPSGGCLLTDPGFSKKLAEVLEYWPECDGNDIELLKNGRIRWLTQKDAKLRQRTPSYAKGRQGGIKILIVVGRDEKDNEKINKLAQKNDIIIELAKEVGPTTLIRSKKLPAHFALRPARFASRLEAGGSKAGGEVRSKNKNYEIQVPRELKINELKPDQFKTEGEVINFALKLTGYYVPKFRGQKKRFAIRFI